jgi:phosphotransferase system enzyme I (PtsI)
VGAGEITVDASGGRVRAKKLEAKEGDWISIDGTTGEVLLGKLPTQPSEVLQVVIDGTLPLENSALATAFTRLLKWADARRRLGVRANADYPRDAQRAREYGAEGIGLFRSEFLFFAHPRGFPSLNDQLETYAMLAREMAPHPVAVRTLDAGGDKSWARAEPSAERNPSMGLRGIRLSLRAREQFQVQVEAILRASAHGRLEIVLPMISTVEELWDARKLVQEVRSGIRLDDGRTPDEIPIGAMIEVPAAVLTLDRLAREVDFLCVGTNDLIQYLLAVDRENPKVAHLFQPLHPSILQCLARIAATGAALKKPVRLCGEMSSNPFFAVLFLGMGYDQLSMNPRSIPPIRRLVRSVTARDARIIVEQAMTFSTAKEIADFLIAEVSRLVRLDLTPFVREVQAGMGLPPPPGA